MGKQLRRTYQYKFVKSYPNIQDAAEWLTIPEYRKGSGKNRTAQELVVADTGRADPMPRRDMHHGAARAIAGTQSGSCPTHHGSPAF